MRGGLRVREHAELFRAIYPWTGRPRVVEMAKLADWHRPFLHYAYTDAHLRKLTKQLSREHELR